MASFFRARPRAARRRHVGLSWSRRLSAAEPLEPRALLSANLGFALAGPSLSQAFGAATDTAGNVYELTTDAVSKFTAAGAPIWTASFNAFSGINAKEGLAVDAAGDVYITGNFLNLSGAPATFGATSLSANNVNGYLAKLDSNGNFLWAQSFGGNGEAGGVAVAVDSLGDAVVTGHFSGTATIGSGANVKTLTSDGGFDDILVAKVDPNGALLWANGYGSTDPDDGRGVAVDAQGDVYVTGQFGRTVDFDPAKPLTHTLSAFFNSAFVLKLDSDGGYMWVKGLNANLGPLDGAASGEAITVDAAGNVYDTGTFGGKVDLNPNGGDVQSANFVFPDAYVLKLDSSGSFDWASVLHNVSGFGVAPNGITVDSQGNVYTAGSFQGVVDFDPGAGTDLKTNNSAQSAYVSVLNGQGNFAWDVTAGNGSTTFGYGVAVSNVVGGANVYLAGSFSGTIDFDPGPGTDNVSANDTWDSFLWGVNFYHNSIAGVVWNDQNGDGVRQSNEPGMVGVPVILYQGVPGSGTQVAATSTDSLGLYSFRGLGSQNYYIQVGEPAGDTFTSQNAGPDPTVNSNVSATTGQSNAVSLSPGQTAMVNAGFRQIVAPPAFGLAFGIATTGFTEGSSIIPDPLSGGFYIGGTFQGTSQFGSGPGAVTLTSSGPSDFVAKYAPDGEVVWAINVIGGAYDYASKLQLDGFGNAYMVGEISFNATIGGIPLVAAASGNTVFLAKFDSNGNTLWATTSVTNAAPYNVGLAVDSVGDAYITGGFTGTAVVNTPAPTTLASFGATDAFIVKYSPDGRAQWAKDYGSSKDDEADSVAVDPAGNPVITGIFSDNMQFGGTTLNIGTSSLDDFIAKLSASDGSAIWAKALTSTTGDGVPPSSGEILFGITTPLNRIAVDAAGNVYTTGQFEGTIQLDPNNATDPVTGVNATFFSKLDANGNFVWGKGIGIDVNGFQVTGYGIAVDAQGDVFTTGSFTQTINFTPGGSQGKTLTSAGNSADIFLLKLDKNGNYLDVQQFGGANEDEGTAVSVDRFGNVYATGDSHGPATFVTATVGAASEQDIFVLRLGNAFGPLVNTAPSFNIEGPLQAVPLNAGPQTAIGFVGNIVVGSPGEANEIGNFIVTNDNNALFSVQPAISPDGTLTYTPAAGAAGAANVTVTLRNDGGTANGGVDTSASQTFAITVGVNHAPSFTAGPNQIVNENAGAVQVLGWASKMSAGPPSEAAQTLNFIVTTNNDAIFSTLPAIDPLTGNLTYALAPNVSTSAAPVTVTVKLHDNGGTAHNGQDTSAPQTFTITVNFVNQAPQFTKGADQAVFENGGPQTVPAWATGISAGPPSESGQKLNFIVTTDDNQLFATLPAIDPATGDLTFTPAAKFSGTATVTVVLHDDGGSLNGGKDSSTAQTFAITVNYVNQAPSFSAGPDVSVEENSGQQVVAGWATNIDPGAPGELGQLLDFDVVKVVTTNNIALFSAPPTIDPLTGNLVFTPASDVFGTATVTVALQDNGGVDNGGHDTSPPQTFQVTINHVNAAPSFTAGGDQAVNEDSGPQTVLGWASSISAGPASEADQALNFIVSSDNDSLFSTPPSIDPSTGALTYTPGPDASGVAHVTVQLHDDGGVAFGGVDTSASQSFTIAVNFVNQAPRFTAGGDQTVHESAGPQTIAGWATRISTGAATEASQTLNFVVTTDDASLFSSPPAIDPATGDLTFTPALYAIGSANVTVALHDDGGVANGGRDASPAQTFTITVTDSNQAPQFTAGPDQTLRGSFGPQTVNGWASNITAGPPREMGPGGQLLTFLVSTDNDALFLTPPAIDPTTGDLTYTPVPGLSGAAHVRVQLQDNGGTANGGVNLSAPQTFLIAITFVNQAPSFTPGADQVVNENDGPQTVVGWASNMIAGPPDESAQALTFTAATDNDALFSALPVVDPVTGDLTYVPAPNANGVAHVIVKLHDSGGTVNSGQDTSAGQTLTITVKAVNQPPSFAAGPDIRIRENAAAQTFAGWAQSINSGAANESSQTLNFTFTLATADAALFSSGPAIDPTTGNLTFTPAPNANGTASVQVALHDDGGTTNGGQDTSPSSTFKIAISPVNQPPTFTPPPLSTLDQFVNEDAGQQTISAWAANISAGAANEAQQTLNFVVTTDNNALFSSPPQIDAATGNLTYTPAANSSGAAHVRVQLFDNGGIANGGQDTSPVTLFTIHVNPVNDAPSFHLAGDPSDVNENSGAHVVANFATQISPSGTFPVEGNEAGQSVHFNVDYTNAGLFATPPAIDSAGTLSYTLKPAADGASTVTVTLQDNGGTLNGGVDASAPQTFTITVNLVNEAPFFTHTGGDQTVNEDSAADTVSGWAAASPGVSANEAGQHINYLVTTANPGLFAPGGQPAVDPSGTLTFTPGTHVFGSTLVSVIAEDDAGTDHGGVNESPPVSFRITLNQVNHTPALAADLGPVNVNENAVDKVFSDLSQVFDDIDIPFGDQLSLSLAPSDSNLVTASLSGTNPLNSALTLHFAHDQTGSAEVDLIATDQSGETATDKIQVTVNQVNQAPTFAAGSDVRVAMNSDPVSVPWAKQISVGPSSDAGQTANFQVSVVSSTNPNLFSALPAIDDAGNLKFTPAANQFGAATVSVTLHDDGGTDRGGVDASAPVLFQIDVDGPPQAIDHSYVMGPGASATAPAGAALSGATDPEGGPLTAILVSPPANGAVQLNQDGSFTYTKGLNFQGTDAFTYQVSNSVGVGNTATVHITSDQAATVDKLYEQVLNRPPDADGLHYWTQQIQNFQPYSAIAQGIFESNERLDPIIEGYYQQFLRRPADAAGVAYWRDQVWKVDGGPEQVIGGMISSPEFFASATALHADRSPNAAWVTTLYERLLNRLPDDQGLKYWTNQLDAGLMSRLDVVNGFEYSVENFQNLTVGFFQEYLGRAPSASELASYVAQFQQGATQRDIQIELIDSPEYRDNSSPPAGSLKPLA